MSPKSHWIYYGWAGVLIFLSVGIVAIYQNGFQIRRDLFSVLPKQSRDENFLKAEEVFRDRLGRQLIFAIVDPQMSEATSGAERLADHLSKSSEFKNVQSRFGERDAENLFRFYSGYTPLLMSQDKIRELKSKSNDQIVNSALSKIYSPTGGAQVASLASDPFSLLSDFLMKLSPQNGPVVHEGFLTNQQHGQSAAFVFAQIADDWQDFETQSQVVGVIDSFKDPRLLRLGLVPYMKAGVEQAKLEISTIGIGSLIGSAIVVLLLFRSALVLLASVALTTMCLLMATLLSHTVFGSLHFFTLIFGSSLVGLFVDYSFHFFSQRFEDGVENGRQARDKVKTALAYSFFSTIIGFSFLLLTPFPVLREMGAFAVFGFTCASLIIWTFFPLLPHRKLTIRPWWYKLGLGLRAIQNMPSQAFTAIIVVLLVLTVTLTLRLKFDDNVQQLQGLPQDLRAQDKLIKSHLGTAAASDYFLLRAPNLDRALELEETLTARLKTEDLGAGYGLSRWFPSLKSQETSFSTFKNLKPAAQKFYQALQVPGVKQGQWLQTFNQEYQPLDFEKWQTTFQNLPVAEQYLGEIGGQHYLALRLEGVRSLAQLRALATPDVQFFSPTSDTSEIMSRLRTWIIYAGLAGAGVVFLFLIYMGGFSFATYNFIAPSISAFLALGLSSLVIGHVNMFNVLAAILVFALTIDYSFFYYDSRKSIAVPTLIAVSACILTTGLSFGLMSLSQTAAISGFGITIAFGIVLSYTLSPIALRTK